MEKLKETMSAAIDALQKMYEDIERFEEEVEAIEWCESMSVETMLALLKDGSVGAMNEVRVPLIEFLEDYIEQQYIEDERLGKLEDNSAYWKYIDGEIMCSECGHINFDAEVLGYCPHCQRTMTNELSIKDQIILDGKKSPVLCNLCAYGEGCYHLGRKCETCDQSTHCCGHDGNDYTCRCDTIGIGEVCPHFVKRGESKCHCCG